MGTNLTKVFFLASILTSACADSKFSGKTDAGSVQGSAIEGSEGVLNTGNSSNSTAASGPVAACDQSSVGITQVKLLSNGISTQLGTQTLRYELSLLNCKDGSVQSLKDQPILFDLNASLTTGFVPVPYTILSVAGSSISSATLQVVTGSDLFGNTGNYAHWTTQNFNYSSQLDKLILEIKLQNIQVLPRNAADKTIDSFLRIGSAQAVTQPLTITN